MRISDWSSDVCSSDLLVALAACGFLFDQAQRAEARRRGGADEASAFAMRARTRRGFEHAGAQALAAHLHQAEARDAADLDARAVVLQRILHRALHLADVRAMIHVDEVDHDERSEEHTSELQSLMR